MSCNNNNNNNNNNNIYVSLTSVLAERPLTQEDCTVCHAEGATVALRGTTT